MFGIHLKKVIILYIYCVQTADIVLFQLVLTNFSSSVRVAEWPAFGKELLTWLTICSLCILTICNFSYFPIWF